MSARSSARSRARGDKAAEGKAIKIAKSLASLGSIEMQKNIALRGRLLWPAPQWFTHFWAREIKPPAAKLQTFPLMRAPNMGMLTARTLLP
jgi:hypothetical protein